MRAEIVMASAAGLVAVLHGGRRRRRMAMMSVPAWPIPTKNTKFVMSQAQTTGCMFPQMPMPVQKSQPMLMPRMPSMLTASAKATYQPMGGRVASGTRRMASVSRAESLSPFGGEYQASYSGAVVAMAQASSGFGFLTRAMYWSRGLTFNSASIA